MVPLKGAETPKEKLKVRHTYSPRNLCINYTVSMTVQSPESGPVPTPEAPSPTTARGNLPLPRELKPLLRGWLHLGTVPLALAGGIVLISLAKGPVAKWGAAVYLVTSLLLFGISALYHRINWSPKKFAMMRRFDHANIFLLIAGTYTPLALGTLEIDKARVLLIAVWSGAILGVLFRMFWITAPRWIYVPLYVALGWAAVFYLGDISRGNFAAMVLIVIGGLLYTAGALVYAFKWPNPSPKNFGFHEIFHAFTVLAFFCHWTAALLAVLAPVYLR